MKKSNVRVEPPRSFGEEIEFFLQSSAPCAVSCQLHIHSAIEMLYVKEGSYRVALGNAEHNISKGDLILFCSNAMHHVVSQNEQKNSYYVIKASPSLFVNLSKYSSNYIVRFAIDRKENKFLWKSNELNGSEIKIILDELIKEHGQQKYAAEIATKLKIMELLLAILRDGEPGEPTINDLPSKIIYDIMSYVQENFAEDIDEKKLASDFGMSYSYFSRSFKRVTGMTFKQYLNGIRINKAEQLLRLGNNTISDIAISCGYNSVSYFISVYRSIKGKTPYKALKDAKNITPYE